jgi:F-type H+-transporting ATPase subunit a
MRGQGVAQGGTIDALGQFKLHTALGPIGASVNFTQSNVMMVLAGALVLALIHYGARPRAIVPGRLQAAAELAYDFIERMCLDQIGAEGRRFFPFIFTLFFFVLFGNVLGLFPFSFTYTSHMAPLIVPVEIISYLSRPVSLSIRLFANMVAGHVMFEVFASFVVGLAGIGFIGVLAAIGPLALNVVLVGFELLVACLQAYVFAILTCIYLHDAVHLH